MKSSTWQASAQSLACRPVGPPLIEGVEVDEPVTVFTLGAQSGVDPSDDGAFVDPGSDGGFVNAQPGHMAALRMCRPRVRHRSAVQ